MVEELQEVRVVFAVENYEPGIDLKIPALSTGADGVDVTTGLAVRFKESDFVIFTKKVGTNEAGDAGPNNCNLHAGEKKRIKQGVGLFSSPRPEPDANHEPIQIRSSSATGNK